MSNQVENISQFDPKLPELVKQWRFDNKLTMHDVRDKHGISIGYQSGIENGKHPFTFNIFYKYHLAAPEVFPMSLASGFPLEGGSENSAECEKVDEAPLSGKSAAVGGTGCPPEMTT